MLQAEQPPAAVEGDPDRIEPQLGRPGSRRVPPRQPLARHQPHLAPLPRADRRNRLAVCGGRASLALYGGRLRSSDATLRRTGAQVCDCCDEIVTSRVPRFTRPDLAWPAMLACVPTFALDGVSSHEVTVEVDVRRGLATFTLVGLPDRAVRESRERVRAAVLNSGLEFPQKRITVNLAPAHVRKAGPSFDLAIAVGLLGASGQVPREPLAEYALCGELSLTGEIRPVRGALAVALGARRAGFR